MSSRATSTCLSAPRTTCAKPTSACPRARSTRTRSTPSQPRVPSLRRPSGSPQNLAFNPRDFGAVGDGVTDDGPAFAAMFAAILARQVVTFPVLGYGATIVLGDNTTYYFKENLVITQNIHMSGASGATQNDNMTTRLKFETGKCLWIRGTHGYDQPYSTGARIGNIAIIAQTVPDILPYAHDTEYHVGDIVQLPHSHEILYECIVSGKSRSRPKPKWAANHAYAPGDMMTPILLDGHIYKCANVSNFVINATFDPTDPTAPIVITTSDGHGLATAHGLATGNSVNIAGVVGNTNANGTWVITVQTATTFSLNGSVGNAPYISGGTLRYVSGATPPKFFNFMYQEYSTTESASPVNRLGNRPGLASGASKDNGVLWRETGSYFTTETLGGRELSTGWADVHLMPGKTAGDKDTLWTAGHTYHYNTVVRARPGHYQQVFLVRLSIRSAG
jgi:hypothetical protein